MKWCDVTFGRGAVVLCQRVEKYSVSYNRFGLIVCCFYHTHTRQHSSLEYMRRIGIPRNPYSKPDSHPLFPPDFSRVSLHTFPRRACAPPRTHDDSINPDETDEPITGAGSSALSYSSFHVRREGGVHMRAQTDKISLALKHYLLSRITLPRAIYLTAAAHSQSRYPLESSYAVTLIRDSPFSSSRLLHERRLHARSPRYIESRAVTYQYRVNLPNEAPSPVIPSLSSRQLNTLIE